MTLRFCPECDYSGDISAYYCPECNAPFFSNAKKGSRLRPAENAPQSDTEAQ